MRTTTAINNVTLSMTPGREFQLTYYSKKAKKVVTRRATWDSKCCIFTSKKGVVCLTYRKLQGDDYEEGYRTARVTWVVKDGNI